MGVGSPFEKYILVGLVLCGIAGVMGRTDGLITLEGDEEEVDGEDAEE